MYYKVLLTTMMVWNPIGPNHKAVEHASSCTCLFPPLSFGTTVWPPQFVRYGTLYIMVVLLLLLHRGLVTFWSLING